MQSDKVDNQCFVYNHWKEVDKGQRTYVQVRGPVLTYFIPCMQNEIKDMPNLSNRRKIIEASPD